MQPKAPPLPKLVFSPHGDVRVMQCKRLPDADDPTQDEHGNYDPKKRLIRILRRLEGWAKRQAFHHEKAHMHMYDAGLHTRLTEDDLEHVAEVWASAAVAEEKAALSKPLTPSG